jgi:hypothetical protein
MDILVLRGMQRVPVGGKKSPLVVSEEGEKIDYEAP